MATPGGRSTAPAVLFDVDGTLVDSTYLHVHAWSQAFDRLGRPVEAWRIHRSIGMDASQLIESLVADADDDMKAHAKDLHAHYYQQLTTLLRPLPGARELIDGVKTLGLQVVLATSAPEDELAKLREVLDVDELVSAVTSSEDVDTAKPQPDIVEVALARAGVTPQRAVFVGDAVWDIEACRRVGVPAVAVRCGGIGRDELQGAGAADIYDDPADLCRHLESSPIGRLVRDARAS